MADLNQQAFYNAGPAANSIAVTPSDTVSLTATTRALYVGTSGNLTVLMAGGQTTLFTAVPAGSLLPLQVTRVNATGTAATNLIAMW